MDAEKKAIILGNGPSLKGFDFSRLSQFDVFGLNAAYRFWDEINWYPKYYACLDLVVGLSHASEIKRLIETSDENGIELFLLRDNLVEEIGSCHNHHKIINFDIVRRTAFLFGSDPITTGSHAAAWAALLGYNSIYLLGIDCDYKEIVPGARNTDGYELEIVEEQANPNYFFEGYQRKGDRFNIPNPQKDLHLRSWRQVGHRLRKHAVKVRNANAQSKVDAFEFCTFEDISGSASGEADAERNKSRIQRGIQRLKQYGSFLVHASRRRPVLTGSFLVICIAASLSLGSLMEDSVSFFWGMMGLAFVLAIALSHILAFRFARSLQNADR